jgi:large subunit ribosomal protein L6
MSLNFLITILLYTHFSLGRTSIVAMEAKIFQFLNLVGVGFKARTERKVCEQFLKVGYNQEVQFAAQPPLRFFCLTPNIICCTGIDNHRGIGRAILHFKRLFI